MSKHMLTPDERRLLQVHSSNSGVCCALLRSSDLLCGIQLHPLRRIVKGGWLTTGLRQPTQICGARLKEACTFRPGRGLFHLRIIAQTICTLVDTSGQNGYPKAAGRELQVVSSDIAAGSTELYPLLV